MPKQLYIPTPDDPVLVFDLASIGASHEDIAAQLGLKVPKLRKVFGAQLKKGAAAGREQALRTLHATVVKGKHAGLLTFWIKSQCGWRDTGSAEALVQVVREVLCVRPETKPKPEPSLENTPH